MKYILALMLAASPWMADSESKKSIAEKSATLSPQSGESGEIRALFNEQADRVRLMVLLSPT